MSLFRSTKPHIRRFAIDLAFTILISLNAVLATLDCQPIVILLEDARKTSLTACRKVVPFSLRHSWRYCAHDPIVHAGNPAIIHSKTFPPTSEAVVFPAARILTARLPGLQATVLFVYACAVLVFQSQWWAGSPSFADTLAAKRAHHLSVIHALFILPSEATNWAILTNILTFLKALFSTTRTPVAARTTHVTAAIVIV
jgi:hypothetical protein